MSLPEVKVLRMEHDRKGRRIAVVALGRGSVTKIHRLVLDEPACFEPCPNCRGCQHTARCEDAPRCNCTPLFGIHPAGGGLVS